MCFRLFILCVAPLLSVTSAARDRRNHGLRASYAASSWVKVQNFSSASISHAGAAHGSDGKNGSSEVFGNLPAKVTHIHEGSPSGLSHIMRLLNSKKEQMARDNQARLAQIQNGDGGEVDGVFVPFEAFADQGRYMQKIADAAKHVAEPQQHLSPLGTETFDRHTPAGQLSQKRSFIMEQVMRALGGTGAHAGSTGNAHLDRELLRRMASQDLIVLIMLAVIYIVTLMVGWSIVYRMSQNTMPVKFYSDQHHMLTLGEEAATTVDGFLHTFNSAPNGICLQVTGFRQSEEGQLWRGHHYVPEFCFSLDLSPWIVRAESVPGSERQKIHDFLRNGNVLQHAEIQMDVEWKNWEELAINIKQQIRSTGFEGPVDIHFASSDKIMVFQNATWANFMHSQTTKALCALSIVGILLYVPYMWIRCTKAEIKSKFKIDINIRQYWNLISDKLTAQDFLAGDTVYQGHQ